MLRISRETGGKLACRRDWLPHPLVVRRAAPSSLRMIIRSTVARSRESSGLHSPPECPPAGRSAQATCVPSPRNAAGHRAPDFSAIRWNRWLE